MRPRLLPVVWVLIVVASSAMAQDFRKVEEDMRTRKEVLAL
ncbi:MAG TPA: hypothetical protein VMU36_11505 [Spirochaetia bacterium]|nr:hypothetical protein [Spirochaetia bacterium]